MALIDECVFHAQSGKGGNGTVRWMRAKFKPKMGPGGGNGGRGGSVRVRAVPDLMELARVKRTARYKAEDGEEGGNYEHTGKSGIDVIIVVPIGTVITRMDTGQTWEFLNDGEEQVLLQGGTGGFGNAHFKSSTNVAPQEATPGGVGIAADFKAELRLIADLGLIGLPNAGKSSLLNTLTKSKARVGAYAFTTLEPNLGEFRGFIIADIPGLIEGASSGRGLGHKFLRHVARTRLLLHLISLENENVRSTYELIRRELEAYDPILADKPEIIVFTKTDMADDAALKNARKALEDIGRPIHAITILDDTLMTSFADILAGALSKQT